MNLYAAVRGEVSIGAKSNASKLLRCTYSDYREEFRDIRDINSDICSGAAVVERRGACRVWEDGRYTDEGVRTRSVGALGSGACAVGLPRRTTIYKMDPKDKVKSAHRRVLSWSDPHAGVNIPSIFDNPIIVLRARKSRISILYCNLTQEYSNLQAKNLRERCLRLYTVPHWHRCTNIRRQR